MAIGHLDYMHIAFVINNKLINKFRYHVSLVKMHKENPIIKSKYELPITKHNNVSNSVSA